MSMQTFFVENDRNFQAAVFQEKFLDFVGEFRGFARVFAFACVAGTGHLSEAISFFEKCFGFLSSKLPSSSSMVFGRSRQMQIICAAFSSSVMRAEEVFGPLFGG